MDGELPDGMQCLVDKGGAKRARRWRRGLVAALIACGAMPILAQSWPFPWPQDRIAEYTARRASSYTFPAFVSAISTW